MNKISVWPVLILITGAFAGGFLLGKSKYKPDDQIIQIDTRHVSYHTGTSVDAAHAMSVEYRNATGLCGSDAMGGVFEFKDSTAYDLVKAVAAIKKEVSPTDSRNPVFFRAVFGINAARENKLIVSGLNAQNREYRQFIKIIDGHLPCPILCDISLSDIIMGTTGTSTPCN